MPSITQMRNRICLKNTVSYDTVIFEKKNYFKHLKPDFLSLIIKLSNVATSSIPQPQAKSCYIAQTGLELVILLLNVPTSVIIGMYPYVWL